MSIQSHFDSKEALSGFITGLAKTLRNDSGVRVKQSTMRDAFARTLGVRNWHGLPEFAQYFGRSDDVWIINYQLGGRKTRERHWERTSNTINPFAQGTPIQASISLLPAAGGSHDEVVTYDDDLNVVNGDAIYENLCRERDGTTR
ncbi:hypothetical protein A3709_18935 [Halioglobus sp. HI00S01]|uniref:hypothetical protein n=1 Tax=Halioglobus sp. HI00S01 TaxID=1822214 RepID=UPI0007C20E3D|nr:hypothetical protein [Halioglobus sp. HI00S01]KZX57700.1 hypothetical protein A3709_18935 [Halioglobus sp. HI00S01]